MTTKAQMIKIEKGIQLPSKKNRTYPWLEMEVGDSFFIENGEVDRLRSATYYACKKHQRKFTCRKVNGGVRIWRTA